MEDTNKNNQAIKEMQSSINEYADRINGITIDRGFGAGLESFKITNYTINEDNQTVLIISNTVSPITAEFLSTCSYVKFHLADEILIKEDEQSVYKIEVTKKELELIIKTLLLTYDRLIETKDTPSVVKNVGTLATQITAIQDTLKMRAERIGDNIL